MGKILDGIVVKDAICDRIKKQWQHRDDKPCLAVIRVGEKKDDIYYEEEIKKVGNGLGFPWKSFVFPNTIDEDQLLLEVKAIGKREDIDGILPLLPFPINLRKEKEYAIRAAVPIQKDLDGVSPSSMANLYLQQNYFPSCIAQSIMEILNYYQIPIAGQSVIMVGRSLVVGKPFSHLALNADATVTICHSKTENLKELVQSGDIIVAALGKPQYLTADYFRPGQIVIDVGIHKGEEGLCGDVDFNGVKDKVTAITPVPKGVGAVTTAVLWQHLVKTKE